MTEVAIIEDDVNYALGLEEYFKRYGEETGCVFSVTRFTSAVDFLTGYKGNYGIICMDIDLADMDGMRASRKLREIDSISALLFVTNIAQCAVMGYEVNAMDFMVKPVGYANFKVKIARALEYLKTAKADKIMITNKQGVRVVGVREIRYIDVLGHTVTFHLKSENVSAWGTLKKYEDELKGLGFSRCASSFLVNLRFVTGVKDYDCFVDGEKLQISYARKKPFLKDVADYLGGKV